MRVFSAKKYPDSWEIYLADLQFQEVGTVDLSSKHSVWLCEELANWGTHRVISFIDREVKALLNKENKVTALAVGNGKLAKLCVNTEFHWEQRGSVKLGPGLDWMNKKNWDFRSKETELWDIIATGQIPKNRRMIVEDENND